MEINYVWKLIVHNVKSLKSLEIIFFELQYRY